jgi:hypothetical protein
VGRLRPLPLTLSSLIQGFNQQIHLLLSGLQKVFALVQLLHRQLKFFKNGGEGEFALFQSGHRRFNFGDGLFVRPVFGQFGSFGHGK